MIQQFDGSICLIAFLAMHPLVQEFQTAHTPDTLAARLLASRCPVVLLRTGQFESPAARYSLVTASPFLIFRSFGSRCETVHPGSRIPRQVQFGNPWQVLDGLMSRYELLDEIDRPFPLGGAFGYWGYDLKNFAEPKLPRRAVNDLDLPDCHVGFHDSVVVFDHCLGRVTVISTGLDADGTRTEARAGERMEFWRDQLASPPGGPRPPMPPGKPIPRRVRSNVSRGEFMAAVERIRAYIRAGDIYQANLSHRLSISKALTGWKLYEGLLAASPAPFAAFLNGTSGGGGGHFEIASSSPEQFLRMSGSHIITRPIKGTRPRGSDPVRDAQLAGDLRASPKENAELVMITDLLRNDLGRVCEYGSVRVLELARLEKFAQVQHLVSTVEGRLRDGGTHLAAFASCFPGGSVTGAPKFRAMEIIDELEPLSRGPYCGAIGYLGFNRESQLSIAIRTAICHGGAVHFNVGAGIVADSDAAAEYEETMAKARGFLQALNPNATDQIRNPDETPVPGPGGPG
jgi:para-aminobenzoate synthetase component 1